MSVMADISNAVLTGGVTVVEIYEDPRESESEKVKDQSDVQSQFIADLDTQMSVNEEIQCSASFSSLNRFDSSYSCSDASRSPSPLAKRCEDLSRRKNSRNLLKISIPSKSNPQLSPEKKPACRQFQSSMQTPKWLSFEEAYEVHEKIGQGSQGEVYRCTSQSTGREFAVKKIRLKGGDHLLDISREFFLLESIKHPNVVRAYDFIISDKKAYIIQDYIPGFSMQSIIDKRQFLTESKARFVFKEVLKAVLHLHSHGICHRDITCANIMIEENPINSESSKVKLLDFSNSKSFAFARRMMTKTGTLNYMAPEILSEHEYKKSVDLWSLGIVLFALLTGEFPFDGNNEVNLIMDIQSKKLDFSKQNPNLEHLSESAINLLSNLLQKNPKLRISASTAFAHPWLNSIEEFTDLKNININTHFTNKKRIFGRGKSGFSISPKKQSQRKQQHFVFGEENHSTNSQINLQQQTNSCCGVTRVFFGKGEFTSPLVRNDRLLRLQPFNHQNRVRLGSPRNKENNDTNFNKNSNLLGSSGYLLNNNQRSRSSVQYSLVKY